MAAGVYQGKFILSGARQSLDALTTGTQTYSFIAVRTASGHIVMGNSAMDPNTFTLPIDAPLQIPVSVTGAALFFNGNGVLEFFGIATA